ncbi:phage holin family protein [Jiangella rhizosphaerae]|uniref:Phage holin family protein n=1 Tax=Jiangella rhizosphaerae TaxID=2293569 RepID=A0A418KMF1_9ACTN|nr:phage holin family protein [Jiangella rhizosphaerae]RIQ19571.1 phage holin family protein [Jiangella rhizosphaerae]
MSGVPHEPAHAAQSDASLGELLGEVSRDLSTLVRQEFELAKAELQQSAGRAGRGAGMYGGAGVAAWLTLLFLSIALWWAIADATGHGWSALIVAALWAIVAAVLAAMGRTEMRRVRGAPRTTETVREIPDAFKGQENPR